MITRTKKRTFNFWLPQTGNCCDMFTWTWLIIARESFVVVSWTISATVGRWGVGAGSCSALFPSTATLGTSAPTLPSGPVAVNCVKRATIITVCLLSWLYISKCKLNRPAITPSSNLGESRGVPFPLLSLRALVLSAKRIKGKEGLIAVNVNLFRLSSVASSGPQHYLLCNTNCYYDLPIGFMYDDVSGSKFTTKPRLHEILLNIWHVHIYC